MGKEEKEVIEAKPDVPIYSGGQSRRITGSRPAWATEREFKANLGNLVRSPQTIKKKVG